MVGSTLLKSIDLAHVAGSGPMLAPTPEHGRGRDEWFPESQILYSTEYHIIMANVQGPLTGIRGVELRECETSQGWGQEYLASALPTFYTKVADLLGKLPWFSLPSIIMGNN